MPDLLDALDDADLGYDRLVLLETVRTERDDSDIAALYRLLRQYGHTAEARRLRASKTIRRPD
jgi:hypothetical protein